MNPEEIIKDCGITITGYQPVSGGDINEAFCLAGKQNNYFLKINRHSRHPRMFETEARGLQILRSQTLLNVPQVIRYGMVNDYQYLLLEWLEKGKPQNDCMEKFGAGLALMHQQHQSYFGLDEDNYIGSLPQQNTPRDKWGSFYSENRIIPLVRQLFDSGKFTQMDLMLSEQVCRNLDNLFPQEPPALLHGDLWSGNYMITSSGYAAMYDPSVYYGHREMDIGMTRLFGGFDNRFYEGYHKNYPLLPGWEGRLPLSQLYPLLVHAVLFGGHYIRNAGEIIRQFS
jgi:fructosamine-3-kinase